jgi:chromosome segregation ATPase
MDMIFVWLLAGATLGLLGIFLIASERELKQRRQEIQELKNKLAERPVAEQSELATRDDSSESGRSAELAARNEDLLQTVSELSKKLEASESNAEQLETLRRHLNSTESENRELREQCERLHAKLSALKEGERNDLVPEGAGLDSEAAEQIAQLREQVEADQLTIIGLEQIRDQLAEAEARCTNLQELQKSLQATNHQLETELAAERETQQAFQAAQDQLAEMEQRYEELSQANARMQHENSELRQLVDQYQQNESRWVSLGERLEQLRLKQAEISEKDRWVQEEVLAMSTLLKDGFPDFGAVDCSGQAKHTNLPENSFTQANASSTDARHHNRPYSMVSITSTESADLSESKKKRRFGIFPTG